MQETAGISGPTVAVAAMNAVAAKSGETSPVHDRSLKTPQTERIHALTSLRFFAALFVVFYHTLWFAIPGLTQTSIAGRVVSLGYLSVGFFFLLSGYILSIVYLRDDQPVSKRSFYAARFARVYPLFFVTLVAGTPFLLIDRIAEIWNGLGNRENSGQFYRAYLHAACVDHSPGRN